MERTIGVGVSPGSASEDLISNTRVATVARIFAGAFDLESVSTDDDFFKLGGDSLVAAALINEIERTFGVGLSISVMIESSTPRALAEEVLRASRKQQERILVAVRAAGSGPAIFCVHGTDGESLFPHRFGRRFQEQRPIFGLRAIGLEPGERPAATIEAMAELYLTAIMEAQPAGPYILLGQCGGTMAAWEIAQRLIAGGREVAGLILIDPESHQTVAPFLYRSGLALEMFQAGAPKRASEEILNYAGGDATEATDAEGRRLLVRETMYSALGTYVPKRLDCPTLMICSSERRPFQLNAERGYQHLLGNLEWVALSGSHRDVFGLHMPELIASIHRFLGRVTPIGVPAR